jgi:hypothetical protein
VRCAVEMGSGAMNFHIKFHKNLFRKTKVDWGGGGWSHTRIIIFLNKESRLNCNKWREMNGKD